MALSREAINEFKEICHAEFGVELSDIDAEQRARELLELFLLLSRGEASDEGRVDESNPEPLA